MPAASDVPTGGAWGIVCDQNQQALVGVTVAVADKVVVTNARGLFYLPVTPGDHDVAFYWGSCTSVAKVHVVAGPTSPIQQRGDTYGCKGR